MAAKILPLAMQHET